VNGAQRGDAAHAPQGREERGEGVLTLARAFQLMSQALSEFRSPVGQEALRLRMVAMHGREDPLLDAGRFPRLLRQANDAEVADVRKVGDDDYEISAQRTALFKPLPSSSAPGEEPRVPSEPAEAPTPGEAAGRENGQRLGVRFRRGSRAPNRSGEVPLIGVVQIEPPADAVEVTASEPAAEPTPAPRKPRSRRTRKPAAAEAGGAEAVGAEAAADAAPQAADAGADAGPARPRRPRTRKKPQ